MLLRLFWYIGGLGYEESFMISPDRNFLGGDMSISLLCIGN